MMSWFPMTFIARQQSVIEHHFVQLNDDDVMAVLMTSVFYLGNLYKKHQLPHLEKVIMECEAEAEFTNRIIETKFGYLDEGDVDQSESNLVVAKHYRALFFFKSSIMGASTILRGETPNFWYNFFR